MKKDYDVDVHYTVVQSMRMRLAHRTLSFFSKMKFGKMFLIPCSGVHFGGIVRHLTVLFFNDFHRNRYQNGHIHVDLAAKFDPTPRRLAQPDSQRLAANNKTCENDSSDERRNL